MRLLKGIIIGLIAATAVAGGLVVALVVGTIGLAAVLVRRLFGRPTPKAWTATPPAARRAAAADAIDITATEVTGPPPTR